MQKYFPPFFKTLITSENILDTESSISFDSIIYLKIGLNLKKNYQTD